MGASKGGGSGDILTEINVTPLVDVVLVLLVIMMAGDCVVPILGGLFWNAMFDANPHWDAGTGGPAKR